MLQTLHTRKHIKSQSKTSKNISKNLNLIIQNFALSQFIFRTNREEREIIRGASFVERKTRQKSSIIHKLLLLLCLSGLCVITGLLASFSLPNIWPGFNKNWLYLAPWWIPILQITLLTSVYTTVLISLERYVRIVYVCNFKHCWFFNSKNFK